MKERSKKVSNFIAVVVLVFDKRKKNRIIIIYMRSYYKALAKRNDEIFSFCVVVVRNFNYFNQLMQILFYKLIDIK